MASLQDSLPRLRRFLRDPHGRIHSDDTLRRYWDLAQRELAQKTGFLERVEAYPWPARFTFGVCHDWEGGHCEGDWWGCLIPWEAGPMAHTSAWEPAYWVSATPSPAIEGYRLTQPWEASYGFPGHIVPILTNTRLQRPKFLAFDQEVIAYEDQEKVAKEDPYYQTRTGEPEAYYPLDESERLGALYPRPTITQDDFVNADVYDDTAGLVAWSEGARETGDYGIITEVVETEGQLFVIYQALPTPSTEVDTETDWPDWCIHAVECAVLERAYGADTDGYMPTIRDYWRARKEWAIEALKRFKYLRLRDQEYVMGRPRGKTSPRGPRMPDHYPEAW